MPYLGGCEVLPSRAGMLQLENSALVGMKKILPHGNAMGAGAANRALGPALGTNSPAVLDFFRYQMNAVIDPIFNAGWPGRNQPSAAFSSLVSHSNLLDVVSAEMAASNLVSC
jgi:hypothetical protein